MAEMVSHSVIVTSHACMIYAMLCGHKTVQCLIIILIHPLPRLSYSIFVSIRLSHTAHSRSVVVERQQSKIMKWQDSGRVGLMNVR